MYIVIDVGGTFIKHCVMDREAEIMEKNKFPTPGRRRLDWRTHPWRL